MTDPISDMLVRIKNAQAVGHKTVVVPFSKIKLEIAKVLEKENFIGKVETKGRKINKLIEIELKYDKKEPAIASIKRISKPGQRIYIKAENLKPVRQGYGISVISTSSGLMTNEQAKKKKLGGEILFEIY